MTHVSVNVKIKYCLDCHSTSEFGTHGFCNNCGSAKTIEDTVRVQYEVPEVDDYDISGFDVGADLQVDADTRNEVE